MAYPMEFPLLDEVDESKELFPESRVALVHPQQTGPALGDGGWVVDGVAVAVKLDGERDGPGVRVAVGRGAGTGSVPIVSISTVASPQSHLHFPHSQHAPVCMHTKIISIDVTERQGKYSLCGVCLCLPKISRWLFNLFSCHTVNYGYISHCYPVL